MKENLVNTCTSPVACIITAGVKSDEAGEHSN